MPQSVCVNGILLSPLFFFIAALSVLRSSEEKAPVPQNKFMGDIEELAASYERKLIEVSAVFFYFGPGSVTVMCFTCWMCQRLKKNVQ